MRMKGNIALQKITTQAPPEPVPRSKISQPPTKDQLKSKPNTKTRTPSKATKSDPYARPKTARRVGGCSSCGKRRAMRAKK